MTVPPSHPPTAPPPTLRLTRRLVVERPGPFLLNALLWGGVHTLPVLTGLVVKALFDALSGAAPAGLGPWSLLALGVAVDLVRLGAMAYGHFSFTGYWLELVLLLRRNLLDHLLNAAGTRRLPDSPSEAISRFRDDAEEIAEYVEGWVDLWGMFAFGLVAVGVMAAISPLLTGLILIPLALTLLLTHALRPRIRRVRRRMREATGRITDFIGDAFGGVLALKASGAEANALRRFERLNEARRTTALEDTLLGELFRSVTENMVSIGIGILLLIAAGALRDGSFTVGDFALFVAYLPRLTGVMSFAGAMLVQHKRTGVSFERLQRLMHDAPPERLVAAADLQLHGAPRPFVAEPAAAEPLRRFEVRGLRARHADGAPALAGVDLTLDRGGFTVVTGRIGSGKSTLLRVLLGLLPNDGGELFWNGERIDDPASFLVPPRSAYTAQVPRLFSDSLRENVTLGLDDDRRLHQALDLAVLAPDVARLDGGLDTQVGARGVKLSGGQVQRSAAARMLLPSADLLVIDDLSSALDIETEARLWEGLFRDREATVLAVSHRRAALRRADLVLVMEGGRIVADGDLATLLHTSEALRALWREGDAAGEPVGSA